MRKFLRAVILIAIIAAVATGAYLRFKPGKVAAATNVSTATVAVGSLSATVNAAGNIQAHQTADLAFGQSGVVQKINVKLGDRVKAGDVLGELATADLDLALRNAQVSFKTAQAQYAQAKTPNTAQDIANARAKLDSAQAAYDKVAAGPSQSDLATAQAQLNSAQAAYNAAVKSAGTSGSSLVGAAASLEKARIALQTAQGAYDRVSWRGDVGSSAEAQTLQSATIDFDTAKANYNALAATTQTDADSKIASAASSLQSAQANLNTVKTQVTAADLAAAKATLTQAQNDLDTLLAGPDANTMDIAQNQLEQSQIAVDQAKLKLAQTKVVAPFDGIVTAISAKLGQNISATAFTIADLDHLEIVVNMAEIDVNRIKAAQQAEITLDAVPDVTLQGTVAQIAPAGVQTSGVVNYPVTVALTKAADSVKTGMTANLNIIVEQRDNVLIVPNRAVRTVGRQKVATVLFEGQQIQTPVQTGMSNDTSTEITGGLKEGDVVVVNATTTSATGGGGLRGVGGVAIPAGGGGPPPGFGG